MQLASRTANSLIGARLKRTEAAFEDSQYVVRFAQSVEEIEAALKLRFEVFNLELGEGLASSFQTGRDRDEFDNSCHHLIVMEKSTDEVVGTYRVRTIEMAGNAEGFYSAGEFDLNYLPQHILDQSVELGRACIDRAHRNRQVLFLLWKGLAAYLTIRQKRFTFGCSSITSQDKREGLAAFTYLKKAGHVHQSLHVPVRAGYECIGDSTADPWQAKIKIPKLFGTYLGIGAQIVSPPAIDREFGTIDFLVLLDTQKMEPRARKLFFTAGTP
jgi:putative hemolysin